MARKSVEIVFRFWWDDRRKNPPELSSLACFLAPEIRHAGQQMEGGTIGGRLQPDDDTTGAWEMKPVKISTKA